MKLASFSVVNYRSITKAHKIQMHDMTVLVGKNNEGKSSILRALALAMDVMRLYIESPRALNFTLRHSRVNYNWELDYPISLQERKPNGSSSVDMLFELSESEISDIRSITGIRLTNNIPVRVSINNAMAKIDIPKRGTPAFSNVQKKQRIIEYLCNKIDFNFIPAVRTEKDALRVISFLIEKELSTLESDNDYINATATIERLQQRKLDQISAQLITPLQQFLPSVRDINIHIQKERRRAALRSSAEVVINDGTPTPIQQKGDGIKSLTALAMLNITNQADRISVIAIEEPESHLHPESAHQLYETILALSEHHQVILTTHSPLFVNRSNIKANIIVTDGKATSAKKVKEIRDTLGTKVSDNLINAENVLLVEGEDDKISLEKTLPHMSDKIRRAIQNGTLVIDYLAGAGNLPYKLSFYRSIQCKYHVFLDNDEAGRRAGQSAEDQGLLTIRDLTYTLCNGFPNAELEDCYSKDAYSESIRNEYGVNLNVQEFRGHSKWSDRIANCFRSQGKQWSDTIEKRVKFTVANSLPADPALAFNIHKRSSIDALVNALENLIS